MIGNQQAYRITDLAKEERPRERLYEVGPKGLSTAELIAILLGGGVKGENAVQISQRLLVHFGGVQGLHRTVLDELVSIRGIGHAKAAQIKASIELGRRLSLELERSEESIIIHSPADIYLLVQFEMSALDQEQLRIILLTTRNQVLDVRTIYQGSLNSSMVRVGELFKYAILKSAAALIIVHNHPSGDPTPSSDDVSVTQRIIEAGNLLDIDVLDHIIIGRGRFVSLKERGLAFKG